MSSYQPDHIERMTVGGHIQIATAEGSIPAFWSHPDAVGRFPGVVLIHDWWGITDTERRLSQRFAQTGYYVIVPDLFDGHTAATPQEAMALVETYGGAGGFRRVDTALQVLETHHRCNQRVAAVGLGLGGSMAFEAALHRDDLEAAVACYGFPQRYFGRFAAAKTPILALYGGDEALVPPAIRDRLRAELAESPLSHELVMVDGAARDFFDNPTRESSKTVWATIVRFLDRHLEMPRVPSNRPT